MRNLFRYAMALAGPVGSAGAQFLLSLVLLRVLDTAAFGRFSILLVASQLSWGIWSALFCAPLPILMADGDPAARERTVRALFTANLAGAVVAFLLFTAMGLALDESLAAATLFAGYAAIALLRWFARAHAYATGAPLRTTASDMAYTVILTAGLILLLFVPHPSLALACALLLASAMGGLLPFGLPYARRQFRHVALSDLPAYRPVWRQHAGWSLIGVLTTEATANAHAYLVVLLRGPGAFAPLAASALLIRPISVAMNALTEFERAQMARQIGEAKLSAVRHAVRFFRAILLLVWAGTAIATLLLFTTAPHLLFPRHYDLHFLAVGATLWIIVGGVRLLRTPESTMLQAAGAFRPLAMASVWSSGISVIAVLALLLALGPLWSIGGILIGELVFAFFIWQQARAWLARNRDGMTS